MNLQCLRATLALTTATLCAACGSSDGGPSLSFPDSVSTADAQTFGLGVVGYAYYLSETMNFDKPSIALVGPAMAARITALRPRPTNFLTGAPSTAPDFSLLDWRNVSARSSAIQRAAGEGCTTTIRGSLDPLGQYPIDQNDNGIPDDLYVKWDCTYTVNLSGDTVRTDFSVRETHFREIPGSLYGVTVTLVANEGSRNNHGRYYFDKVQAEGTLDIRPEGLTDRATLLFRGEESNGGEVESYEAGDSWDNAFTPSGTITATNGSGNLPSGALTITGRRYYADNNEGNVAFTVSTLTPLKYSAACAEVNDLPPFTEGLLLGALNNDTAKGKFEARFSGCGLYTVTVANTYDPTTAATR